MKKGGMDRDPLPLQRLYPGKPKLTEAEYLAGQGGDKAEFKTRFLKLDGDKDGFLTREKFIGSGKKK